jgi:hypothetical protein
MAIDFAFVMFIKIGTIEDGLPLSIVILEAWTKLNYWKVYSIIINIEDPIWLGSTNLTFWILA